MPGPEDAGPSTPPRPTYESLQRPPFRPKELSPSSTTLLTQPGIAYIPTFSHAVHFTLNNFFAAIKELTLHPERNSSLILRADPLPARQSTDDDEVLQAGLTRREEIRVRLLPKQVKRDGKLDQRVSFYEDTSGRGVVVMVPEVKDVGDVPFYHPPVNKLAFMFEPLENEEHNDHGEDPQTDAQDGRDVDIVYAETALPMRGVVTIAYLPFPPGCAATVGASASASTEGAEISPPASSPFLGVRPVRSPRKRSPLAGSTHDSSPARPPAVILNPDETSSTSSPYQPKPLGAEDVTKRTVRTCRLLLERVYKHAYGDLVGYQKRVLHDVVVNRESFQDLYLILKDRHRHLDSRVTNPRSLRVEDVKRHVWKDIAIATFLMLLWKEMYPTVEQTGAPDSEVVREWDTWGRPPGGFIDLGCGNGLLVHVLVSEGYQGKGYELRARKTWPNYPPRTRDALVEKSISFPDWFPHSAENWFQGDWTGRDDCPIRDGCFIIGNHADEITPWIPLLSLLPPKPVPYLSLPCCFHTLDDSWNALTFTPPSHPHTPDGGFEKGLEEGQSRYKAYLVWLGWMGLMCGWEWEKEGLRIPSTKGWGIVARKRWTSSEEELAECRRWALEQVQGVRDRGAFKIREREGKDAH